MKIKLFLLVILSTFIVYLIYESAPPKEPYILSIYDKTTLPKTNYNDILKTTLAKNKPNIIYDTTLADYN